MDLTPHIPPICPHRKKCKETNASEKNKEVHQTNSRAVSLKVSGTQVPIQQAVGLEAMVSGFAHPEHPKNRRVVLKIHNAAKGGFGYGSQVSTVCTSPGAPCIVSRCEHPKPGKGEGKTALVRLSDGHHFLICNHFGCTCALFFKMINAVDGGLSDTYHAAVAD